eukprot:TRINITY_DN5926_c0_g1_i3.p1 TRINITY_DN5926_c0_g1~~TRINITY_DN5926_c0_g1_i3.p1  ORF type:complete len:241 (-),score=71.52 TRINITY_DN5926_c0_g1_i3:99-821(-)
MTKETKNSLIKTMQEKAQTQGSSLTPVAVKKKKTKNLHAANLNVSHFDFWSDEDEEQGQELELESELEAKETDDIDVRPVKPEWLPENYDEMKVLEMAMEISARDYHTRKLSMRQPAGINQTLLPFEDPIEVKSKQWPLLVHSTTTGTVHTTSVTSTTKIKSHVTVVGGVGGGGGGGAHSKRSTSSSEWPVLINSTPIQGSGPRKNIPHQQKGNILQSPNQRPHLYNNKQVSWASRVSKG